MNAYTSNSTVDRHEAEALKEMIFNRVRARAEAINNDVQTSYVDNIQNDLMDSARNAFIATKNPFSLNNSDNTVTAQAEKVEKAETKKETIKVSEHAKSESYEKFQTWLNSNEDLKLDTEKKTAFANEKLIKDTITSTMDDARSSYEKKSNFMGALDFLNSQASIALVNRKGSRFEANA